jgi:hypothetical protein
MKVNFISKVFHRNNLLVINKPADHIMHVFKKIYDKAVKDNNCNVKVTISNVFKGRSTGKRSQNARINGHIQIICQETGNEFEAVKGYVKQNALGRGYPFVEFNGKVTPKSESEASSEEAKILIDVIEQLAAELDIILPEYE